MNEHNHDDLDFMMAYQDSCDIPALQLIHGFPLNGSMWLEQMEDLGNFARVIAPDLRGFGQSEAVAGPYSMALLADDCADLLGHLSVLTPFVIGGHSMGGYVAFEFYRNYKDHIGGLILTATRAAPDTAVGKENRDKMIDLVRRRGVTAVIQPMLDVLFAPQTYEADPELVDFVRDLMETASPEGVIGALQAMRDRPDSRPTLPEIDVPVLIIHGADDQIVPVSEAEEMAAAISDCKLVILEDAGHMPNLEQPDAFNDAVIDFLEELDLENHGF